MVVTLLEPIQQRSEPIPGETDSPAGNSAVATAAAHVVEFIIRKCSELFKVCTICILSTSNDLYPSLSCMRQLSASFYPDGLRYRDSKATFTVKCDVAVT